MVVFVNFDGLVVFENLSLLCVFDNGMYVFLCMYVEYLCVIDVVY